MIDEQLQLRPVRVPTVLYRRIAQIDYLKSEVEVFRLGGVGLEIWRRIDGARSLREIADEIAQTCGADPAEVRNDVVEFTQKLLQRGLVTVERVGTT
jgi:hypothetical protein